MCVRLRHYHKDTTSFVLVAVAFFYFFTLWSRNFSEHHNVSVSPLPWATGQHTHTHTHHTLSHSLKHTPTFTLTQTLQAEKVGMLQEFHSGET